MEYVEGQTLRRRLEQPLSVAEFLDIAEQCASALAAAHKGGVQHRDIKPENLMLTAAGELKVLDFGLARTLLREDGTTLESAGSAKFEGTFAYMSPEALQEKATDERADIFSLGVVFYEALGRRHPFRVRGAGFLETYERILHEELGAVAATQSGSARRTRAHRREDGGQKSGGPVCVCRRSGD